MEKAHYPVTVLCEVMQVSRSGYYDYRKHQKTQTDEEEELKLIDRAQSDPKPLYYRPEFLREQLDIYLRENQLSYAAEVGPDDFTRWVFPRLFHSRIPRYEAIARPHGYTVTSQEVSRVRDESDFLELLETVIARTQ